MGYIRSCPKNSEGEGRGRRERIEGGGRVKKERGKEEREKSGARSLIVFKAGSNT